MNTTHPRPSPDHPASRDRLAVRTGWRDFLSGLDPVWQAVPTGFHDGPFLGNGGLSVSLRRPRHATRLTLVLGDSRVRDHQEAGGPLWGGTRLPIGRLVLTTRGELTGVDLRLSLWDAEVAGTVETTRGAVTIRAFVHASKDLLVVNCRPLRGAEQVSWRFVPQAAVPPREAFYPEQRPTGLKDNPLPVLTRRDGESVCTQDLACGGRTETRWRTRTEPDGETTTLLCTVAHSATDPSASDTAVAVMNDAAELPTDRLVAPHRDWWHAYYPKSFLSVPDGRLQSFYWIQMYKLACATRADRPVLATNGPWLEHTPWPAAWWNLNVQLAYSPIHPTGRTELDSLRTALENGEAGLLASTPPAYRGDSLAIGRSSQDDLRSEPAGVPGRTEVLPETGNLLWALHNAWLAYRHTMDETFLRTTVFPLLRRAVNYHLHFLTEDDSGHLHLPATYSPEYGITADCNYDLALLHWGCGTLLDAAARLGITDPLADRWQHVLDHLTPPPRNAEEGLLIGRDLRLTSSHRHYSHLLWFHPLHRLDVADPGNRALLLRTMEHWLGLTGELQGYSFTGAASMHALLGDGDTALVRLGELLDMYVEPNTMYAETGPVIETPLSGAQSLHDMLLQSWGGVIRIFPAVPRAWADVTVHDLVAEGAFRISARRRDGVTRWIRVRSEAGEPCLLAPGPLTGAAAVRPLDGLPGPTTWNRDDDGLLRISLPPGAECLITGTGDTPDLTVEPVDCRTFRWGLPLS
ncbi:MULTISPECIES: glycoside hydrolase family 95-like protein [Streptomyces]|uniref:Tat pathway signal sequence domain protein n=1 Tax=Streptomyces koelreuteriae TaxID=2838015 RepID=A0ABX8G138_9ACTN|nr:MULTISPECIES: Tat pathway signal sequence domain protein [Streptomyces]QWB27201.1 Tat pathway signal sequence domain protein [Streptomyces koelreuteriae]UUA10284.1 Tat pathway signal sequence domain protein [Streptomyces koelreuteriae]UUA17891.1 Tat pathway signal sequence domain protein [Streptomyces sp. CRCS-T-1]